MIAIMSFIEWPPPVFLAPYRPQAVDAAFFARLPSGRAADDVEKNARCRILRQKEIVLFGATSDFKHLWRSNDARRAAPNPAQLFIISSGRQISKNTGVEASDFGPGPLPCVGGETYRERLASPGCGSTDAKRRPVRDAAISPPGDVGARNDAGNFPQFAAWYEAPH
jgi:hypothetical protein